MTVDLALGITLSHQIPFCRSIRRPDPGNWDWKEAFLEPSGVKHDFVSTTVKSVEPFKDKH